MRAVKSPDRHPHRMGVRLLTALAVIALTATAPAAAWAARGSGAAGGGKILYTGSAYGSYATLGSVVTAGKTAPVGMGCDVVPPAHAQNEVASANVPPLLTLGQIVDTADATDSGGVNTASSTSSIDSVSVAGGVVTASALVSAANVTFDGSTFAANANGTSFADLVVAGIPIGVNVAPNTVLPLPLLGTVTLNEQIVHVGSSNGKITVNAIHVTVTMPNLIGIPVGTQIIVGHASSSLAQADVVAIMSGTAYGLSSKVLGGLVQIGRQAAVSLPCTGTDGSVITNSVASVNVPPIASSGTVTDTAQGTDTATSADGHLTSTVQALNLVSGLVQATTIQASVDGSTDGSTNSFHDGSTFLGLHVAGFPEIGDDVAPNTRLSIVGLGTLWLHRVIQSSSGLEVRMVELNVTVANAFGIAVGTDVRVAVASVHIF